MLAACLAALLLPAGAAGAAVVDAPAPRAAAANAVPGLLAQINQVRRSRGLRPLSLAAGLNRAAAAHARSMAANGYFSHESRDGTSPAARIRRYYPSSVVGEALLWRSPGLSAGEAVQAWLASPPHRALLLSRAFSRVGLGAVHAASAPGTYGGAPVTIVVADLAAR